MLGEEALAHGGTISVQPGASAVLVTASGRRAALRPESAAALAGAVALDTLSARSIHAFITGRFAAHYGLALGSVQETDRVVFTIA
jgi:histidine phosphotransferase ChpT